jgi:hypothetical protein
MTGGAAALSAIIPAVTVEIKEGVCRHGPQTLKIVDLPGTYSLTAYSRRSWKHARIYWSDGPTRSSTFSMRPIRSAACFWQRSS